MAKHLYSNLINLYFKDRFIRLNTIFSISANIGLWLLLFWQVRNFSDLIFLHYNIYFGIDLIGDWRQIFLRPVLAAIFLTINLGVGLLVYDKEKILSYFIVGVSSFIQIIFILAAIFVIIIN